MSSRVGSRLGLIAIAFVTGIPSTMAEEQLAAPASASPSCDSPEHRQFDFWLGSWNVTEAGIAAGQNRIEFDLKSCALFESWTGAGGARGRSVSFYDRIRRRWHQTWIDDAGRPLYLDGAFTGGRMVLEGESTDPATGATVHDRITWTPNPDGSVRQHWERRAAASASWKTVFDGLYRRMG